MKNIDTVLDRLAHPPTIGELVPQYLELGIPKDRAMRYIVDSHLASQLARGRGTKAAKREARSQEGYHEMTRRHWLEHRKQVEAHARKVFGVTKPLNSDRACFSHAESPEF